MEACAVVSEDGLIIASSLPQSIEENSVAANECRYAFHERQDSRRIGSGTTGSNVHQGERRLSVCQKCRSHAVLLTMARKEAKLGLIFLDINRGAQKVEKILD